MMNIWALIAIFFATLFVFTFYALVALRDDNKLLRASLNHLWREKQAQESHLAACGELLGYCQEIERRNEYIEAIFTDFKGTIAGAKLMAPSTMSEDERFTVRQGSEGP